MNRWKILKKFQKWAVILFDFVGFVARQDLVGTVTNYGPPGT